MTSGTVFLATIIVSAPEFGVALVTTAEGSTDIKHLLIAHLPMNDSGTGVVTQSNYVDGTAVVCILDENKPNKAYIVAPVNFAIGDKNDSLYGRAIYNTADYNESDSKAFVNALEQLLGTTLSIDFQNFAHGVDINALPGDNDQIDMNGNAGIHIGRFVAQLRGSPIAFIDVANITHAIRMVANKMEQHLPLSYILNGKYLSVHNIATSEDEAFGVSDDDSVVVNDGVLEFNDENAIPLYRLQQTEGAAVDGKEELVVGFPVGNRHYVTTEPPILAKKRTAIDGTLSEASAQAITSIKSPAIQAIHQVAYNKDKDPASQQDILQPYEPTYIEPEEYTQPEKPEFAISDAAINKLIDTLFTGDYLERLQEKMAEHGLAISTKEGTLETLITGSTFKTGPTNEQEYGLPDQVQLTDPVTGKTSTYFKSTSFISQEPDGSILICDGYGSEIRMSRGNIYISPALDLFFRPGRDLSAMVPRHQSYNAQSTTTINTAGNAYIRATGDLKIAGATDGSGVVTLECDAKDTNSVAGLIIRSTSGATLTGADIYIGINSGIGPTTNNVVEPARAGTIVIDACSKGKISMRSNEQLVDSNNIYLLANMKTTEQGSAILINDTHIGIYTRTVDMPASVRMTQAKAENKVTVVRNGAAVDVSLVYSSFPQLMVESSVVVGGSIICNKQGRFCEGIVAKGVASTSPFCGVVSYKFNDPFELTEIDKPQPITVGDSISDNIVQLTQSIYQDSYVSSNSFAFPTTYNVPVTLRVPGMLWQTQTGETGPKWSEPEMKSPDGTKITMCYPGAEVWGAATISDKKYKTTSLNKGYITNAIKEKANG